MNDVPRWAMAFMRDNLGEPRLVVMSTAREEFAKVEHSTQDKKETVAPSAMAPPP